MKNDKRRGFRVGAIGLGVALMAAPVVVVGHAEKGVAKAVAELKPASGSKVQGSVTFSRKGDATEVKVELTGLEPGPHGFHIHDKGDCSAPDASSAGAHFNPTEAAHAGPDAEKRHVGDLGNVVADEKGVVKHMMKISALPLEGPHSIVGRGVIVHGGRDDLKTQPSGDAGSRVACGVVRAE